MPRVSVICEYPTLNGGEQSLLAVLPGLAERGFDIEVACPAQGPLANALRAAQVPTHDWQVGPTVLHDRAADRLADLLHDRRPDLVHANSLSVARKFGDVTAGRGTPAIAHLRDIVRMGGASVANVRRFDRLLAVSAATKNFHVAQGLPAEKVHVLYNGVDTHRFRPRVANGWLHRRLGLPENCPLVGAIGQLGPRKGQDVLIAAARLLASRWPRMHYVLVGERNSRKQESRDFEAALSEAFANGPLTGRGRLVGRIEAIEETLPELSLLVHAARQEPLGRVLLEAAAAGTPVVATEAGGTAEIFPPAAGAALLVPPGDPLALASAMETLLVDPAARAAQAALARELVTARFSASQAAAGLAEHYAAVLARRE